MPRPRRSCQRAGVGTASGGARRHDWSTIASDVAPRRLRRAHSAFTGALRARDRVAARRIDPDDRLHRAIPAVHRIGPRAVASRRRRQRIPRLPVQLHLADPRSCPSGRGRRRSRTQVRRGSAFAAPTETEVLLAEEIRGRLPSVEQLRFTSSGTEATMFAIRAARAFTGRPLIAKFDHSYHGTHDGVMTGHRRRPGRTRWAHRRAAVGRSRRYRSRPARPRSRSRGDHPRAGAGRRRRPRARARLPAVPPFISPSATGRC